MGRNYIYKDDFTDPFPKFNGTAVEVWEWISNFIPHFTGYLIDAGIRVNLCKPRWFIYMQQTVSSLVQLMVYRLIGAKLLPESILWSLIIVNPTIRDKFQWNLNKNTNIYCPEDALIFCPENAPGTVVSK